MISLLWGNYLLLRAFRTASLNLFFGDDREIIFLISIPFFPSTVYCYWPFFPYPIKCQVINYLIARSLSRFRLLGFRVPVFCTISLIIKIHRSNYITFGSGARMCVYCLHLVNTWSAKRMVLLYVHLHLLACGSVRRKEQGIGSITDQVLSNDSATCSLLMISFHLSFLLCKWW